jgi:hypothetical protein
MRRPKLGTTIWLADVHHRLATIVDARHERTPFARRSPISSPGYEQDCAVFDRHEAANHAGTP